MAKSSNKSKGFKVEQVVDFIAPDVKFVSLVSHAANRQPFKILKSQDGGISMPDTIIKSVLIPKSLDDEAVEKALEGYNTADVTEYETYDKYDQVSDDAIKEGTEATMFLDRDNRILAVTAELAEASKEDDSVPEKLEKEKVDWATIDSVLDEAYAFLDITLGAFQQSGMEKEARKSIILSALKNFETFLNQMFDSTSDKAFSEPLDISKKEHLIYPIYRKDGGDNVSDTETTTLTVELVQSMIADAIGKLEIPAIPEEDIKGLKDGLETVKNDVEKNAEAIAAKKGAEEDDEALKKVQDDVKELQGEVETLFQQPQSNSYRKYDETSISHGERASRKTNFEGLLFSKRKQ
jgi:hypothetical protein